MIIARDKMRLLGYLLMTLLLAQLVACGPNSTTSSPSAGTTSQSLSGLTSDSSSGLDTQFAFITTMSSNAVLYGATHYSAHASNTSSLYEVSTKDGSTKLIGDIGFKVNGMAYNPVTRKLYGITEGAGSQLIEINKANGLGTLIATITGPATSVAVNNGWNGNYMTAVGATGSNFYAQSFIANTNAITKFGVVIQQRIPQGELILAIAADNGGVPNYAAPLYQGTLRTPTPTGAWYYETGINVPLTIGQKYYILYDGYDNPGATGWDAIGLSSTYPIAGEGIIWSNSGGVGSWDSFGGAYPLAIYVEGATTYSHPAFNSKGELFAYNTDNTLCRINVTTGVATSLPTAGVYALNYGLAFDKNDTLYLVNGRGGQLYTMDQTTGAGTLAGSITGLPNTMAHRGGFHPVSGEYWGLDATNVPTRKLLAIDIGTRTVKQTITTLNSLHALAFGNKL